MRNNNYCQKQYLLFKILKLNPLQFNIQQGPKNMARSIVALIVALFFSAAVAFVNNGAARSMVKSTKISMQMDFPKAAAAFASAAVASPVFASDALTTTFSTANEVTGPAYLAVLLGTFVPVTFLIVLYTQSEARKSGNRGVK